MVSAKAGGLSIVVQCLFSPSPFWLKTSNPFQDSAGGEAKAAPSRPKAGAKAVAKRSVVPKAAAAPTEGAAMPNAGAR